MSNLRGRAANRRVVGFVSGVCLLLGVFAGPALATNPPTSADDQYAQTQPVAPAVKPATVAVTTAAADDSDTLPVTGKSLLGVVVIGAGLVGAGFVLRRRDQRDDG